MASPAPFRVRYGGGAYLPVLLGPDTSAQDVKEVVAATVNLAIGTFVIQNADRVKSAFHAGLTGNWDVVLLPGQPGANGASCFFGGSAV